MEAWKSNLEGVIKKWEKKGPPSHIFEKSSTETTQNGKLDLKPRSNGKDARKRLRPAYTTRQERRKEMEYWASLEMNQAPKKFKLFAITLKPPRAAYQMHQCIRYQNIQKDGIFLKRNSYPSTLFNVFDTNEYARKKSIICLFAPELEFVLTRTLYSCPTAVLSSKDLHRIEQEATNDMKQENGVQGEKKQTGAICSVSGILSKYNELVSYTSSTLIRLVSWTMLKFFRSNFSSICCQNEDIRILKETSKKNIPVVYIPVYKSLLDWMIIFFTLYCNNLRLPFTIVPDHVCTSRVCRYVLRKLGIIFVNEECNRGKDVAKAILFEKLTEQLLIKNQSLQISLDDQEFPAVDKQNIYKNVIKTVTKCVLKGVVEDVYLVPISVNYENVCKPSSVNLWKVIKSLFWGFRFKSMIHVRFGCPYSLQDFRFRSSRFPSRDLGDLRDPTIYENAENTCDEMDRIIQHLFDHLKSDCSEFDVISCTNMLSFLLITKHKNGVLIEDLESSFDWLKQELLDAKRNVGFFGETSDVVSYALKILANQDLVEIKTKNDPGSKLSTTVSPAQNYEKVNQLWKYADQVRLVFAMKSIVATSIVSIVGGSNLFQIGHFVETAISRNEVLTSSLHICNLLRYFYPIFPPCIDIMSFLGDILDSFIASGILLTSKESCNQPKPRLGLEDDDLYNPWDTFEADIQYEVDASDENRDHLLFLHSLLLPTIEKIWFATALLSDSSNIQKIKERDLPSLINARYLEKVAKGHSFNVNDLGVETFYHIVHMLIDFGFIEGTSNNAPRYENLKVPITIDRDESCY